MSKIIIEISDTYKRSEDVVNGLSTTFCQDFKITNEDGSFPSIQNLEALIHILPKYLEVTKDKIRN